MTRASGKTSAGKTLVIVESPTKAKTIRKFLGKDYIVESCMGHVRDLPQSAKDIPEKVKKQPWAHLGVNVEEDFDPIYCIPNNKTKVVRALKDKLSEANELILATDEDREGESISWHLLEILKPKVPVKRMVFHEITKEAIEEAQRNFRKIDFNLVHAQEARRILDRLVGYTISPLIWKKVAYGLSAGRVQSVAVRLLCEREEQRLKFKKAEYWSLLGHLEKSGVEFESRSHEIKSSRVAQGRDFDGLTGLLLADKKDQVIILDKKNATEYQAKYQKATWKVLEVEEKPVSRKPAAPFITSTLQQEANRKLGLGAREAMRVAQSLYEQGFITYMRTDSTTLSEQAIKAARACIQNLYGKDYLPAQARTYEHKKSRGAQEAHEAIRPAGTKFITPSETGLKNIELQMYEMIWMRTVASQMLDSQQKQMSIRFEVDDAIFVSSGMTVVFPGFLKAYKEGRDDGEDEKESKLPALKKGDVVKLKKLETLEHETKPPARYTEASLIQMMEREGIGRPSTYAPTISTIMDRGYAKKVSNALVPTFTAMVVNKLLKTYLTQYVDLQFTSKMEDCLDEIASGDLDHIDYLKQIYFGKNGLSEVVKKQEKQIDPSEARSIQFEALKGYDIRVGRYGAYICRMPKKKGEDEICASLPDAQTPGELTSEAVEKLIEQKLNGNDALGKDDKTGKPIYVLNGRYGPYVQLGDSDEEKVKRVSIPPQIPVESVDLERAQELLSLPKTLGVHPGTKKDIKLGIGRFGPYVVSDGDYRSIPKDEFFLNVTLKRALELFAQPKKGRGRAAPIKDLGKHPADGEAVAVYTGKYGPYVKWGKVNASLTEDQDPQKISLEDAVKLLDAKGGGSKASKKAKTTKTSKAKSKEKKEAKTVDEPTKVIKLKPAKVKKKSKASAKKKASKR